MRKIENVRYWRDPEIEGLETCRVFRSRHAFPKHAHDDIYAIGLMEEGGAFCVGPEDRDTFVTPGGIALINPGQVHSGVPEKGVRTTYCMLYVDVQLMSEVAGELGEKNDALPEFSNMIIDYPELFGRLRKIAGVLAGDVNCLEKESIVIDGLSLLISEYGGIRHYGSNSACLNREVCLAKEFLDEDLWKKITLEDVAKAVGISRYHFLRVFKKATGVPPHVYRTQRRIEAAKYYLRKGMPFSDIALETGFADQSHFTNKFRQFTGATPKQYLS